jgi:hypothetical protein
VSGIDHEIARGKTKLVGHLLLSTIGRPRTPGRNDET